MFLKASYGTKNFIFALIQIAQVTMRSEVGKMMVDDTFKETVKMNEQIVVKFLLTNFIGFLSLPCDDNPMNLNILADGHK